MWEEQDMPYADVDTLSRVNDSRQRGERVTSKMAVMMNTSMGVSGVRVGQIPGMGDGGDCSAMATTTTTLRRAIAPHHHTDNGNA